ncbi:GNAT family N-acetyltransferase [Bacillus sp. B15-48]|uniref:GNAT family N-acetyltransferase n=1 Tax=Bacillus sp. B15-48 TaxID=1548601 RepID=UPI00193EC98A|nr:GNAT family N-acetyltransferase [Bacillus sp. B15-48]MBM4762917.1 GNAT family N-acetyltransferase [Bacillus sp. B15-48]
MNIRKATYKETQKILAHSFDVFNEATVGYAKLNRDKVRQLVTPFLNDGGYYLVYVEKNTIQGWVGIGQSIDVYTDDMIGIIAEIYVLPRYRKKGIAAKLCEEALSLFKEEGYNKVQLNVFEGNRAKHLYKKLGFQAVSTIMERSL